MTGGPSAHLSWAELACHDGTPYPVEWCASRAVDLAATFEAIRTELGGLPIAINSAYRTSEYNRRIGGAKLSQHVMGRALDIRHSTLKSQAVFLRIRHMAAEGRLPLLGGIGLYRTFVHIDVRPKTSGRVAVWYGTGGPS